ncbi:MAG: YfbU family protein [Verrucomicrobiota bacterium JB024]|nr:YfbU family protein [Verrucomicrobiota bacterium JB024]
MRDTDHLMPPQLTRLERVILVNQYEILSILKPDDSVRYQATIKALREGYTEFYSMAVREVNVDTDKHIQRLVQDVLKIYRAISHIPLETATDTFKNHPLRSFKGFDNTDEEFEYLGFTQFLLQTMRLYTELRDGTAAMNGFDSHEPMLPKYEAMVREWCTLERPTRMSEKTALRILNAE